MSRSDKKRRNVHQILEMFASLGLHVCDDEDAIKAACEEQRSTRNRELNSTKGSVAARAQQWFDDVNTLMNKRDDLLDIVFEEFCALSDTVLRADIDGGRATLGADTQLALRDIAISWCHARSDLANRWLNDFLENRGLKDDGELDQPRRVKDFKASPRAGRIMLSWTPPADSFDEIRIVRMPDPPTGEGTETPVYQGRDSSFLDTNVSAQGHYTYRAYTIFQGRRSLTASVAGTRKQVKPGSATRPTLVMLVLLAAGVALLAYDRILGSDLIIGGLLGKTAQPVEARAVDPETDTAALPDTDQTVVLEDVDVEDADTAPALDTPVASPQRVERTGPPRGWMTNPPSLAFAGQTLNIELAFSEPMQAELVQPKFEGLSLIRVEFDTDPPSVRLAVGKLPDGMSEGRATWSFRLTTLDGHLTDEVSGACLVIPNS